MELKDLKNTWNKMSSGKELDEKQLQGMLVARSKTLMERVERNVKIGFGLVFLFIVWVILDYFVLTPYFTDVFKYCAEVKIPKYLYYIDGFTNVVFVVIFIFFAIRYYHVKSRCEQGCNIRNNLRKVIGTLGIYKRLFYFAVSIILIEIGLAFIIGLSQGLRKGIEISGVEMSELSVRFWVIIAAISIVVFLFIAGVIFFLLRWGFQSLYGKYLKKLKTTLAELEEMDN